MASGEDARTVGYLVGVAALVGIGGYAAYKLFNPSVSGGSCTTPGSPCYTAVSPYQQEYQACANQYTQLMTQIIQGGNAPTAAQLADLQQLRNCMDDAAANIAKVAQQYVPTNGITTLLTDIGEAILVAALAYYGLKGLGAAVAQYRTSGKITTNTTSGAGVAAIVFDASIQYAVESSQITATTAAAWEGVVSSLSASDISEATAFYNTLAAEAIISAAAATAELNATMSTINGDAGTTIADLSSVFPRGFSMYGYPGYILGQNTPVIPEGIPSGIGAMSYEGYQVNPGFPPQPPQGIPSGMGAMSYPEESSCGCG